MVGHSGAGPLLPAIAARLSCPVGGFVFVDAGLPSHLATRLDMMKTEDEEWALGLEKHLLNGGCFPEWTDADLHNLISDNTQRQTVLAELQPRTLPFFREPVPTPESWRSLPCGYIQFSAPYDVPARQAREYGWPFIRLPTGHFHMLAEPAAVVEALVKITASLR